MSSADAGILQNTKIKLSPWRKIAYAVGDGGNNFSYTFVLSFLVFYATDIFKVNPAVIGTVMLVSRLWDAINDPLIGGLADRTRTKWGAYRPWVLFGGIATIICTILAFTPMPIASETGRTVYLAAVMIVLVTAYTCVNIPYSAMTAVLTQDTDERASITSYRFYAAVAVGGFAVMLLTNPLVAALGGGNPAMGFFWTAVLYGSIALVLYIICFLGTKEVVPPQSEKVTMTEMFQSMKGNAPAWILAGTFFMQGFFQNMKQTSWMYYFGYYAADFHKFVPFVLWYGVGSLIGIFLMPLIGRRLSNKGTFSKFGLLLGGICTIIMYFISPVTNWVLFNVFNVIASAAITGSVSMLYGMVPDVVDFGQSKSGKRAAGFISAFINFLMKVGMSLGIALVGWVLGAAGYVAGAEQGGAVLSWINTMTNLIPGIVTVCGGLLLFGYKLDKKTFNNILDSIDSKGKA